MALLESGENYLETILILHKRNGTVRSVDVAAEMGFSKASISRAMHLLDKQGYLVFNDDGEIDLTEAGLKKASEVYDRHLTLTRFLREVVQVSEETAEKDACRIEHIISDETFAGLKRMLGEDANALAEKLHREGAAAQREKRPQ